MNASLSRRDLLKLGLFGAGATAAGMAVPLGEPVEAADWISTLPARNRPVPYTLPIARTNHLPYRTLTDAAGEYRLYTVTERAFHASIVPGLPTPVLGYSYVDATGQTVSSVPGPVIKVPQGTRVKLRVKNELPVTHPTFGHALATSTHLHGSASLPQYDGYADDVTMPGQYKDYWYPNHQGARTLWYHDHGVHHTAENAYSGLAAQYHLHDAEEQAKLPQGRYDVPLTISDAMFAADGSLAYQDDNHSGMYGDIILVNGTPWPYMEVQRRLYRFRILVATLSRSFNLRLVNVANGQSVPVHVVATDGGLMPTPQRLTTGWRHAGAERYEVLVDFGAFAGLPAGSRFELRNSSNPNNVDFLHTGKVMQFRLSDEPVLDRSRNVVPTSLATSSVMGLTAAQSRRTRRIDLQHDDITNTFMINGRTWHDVQPPQGDYSQLLDNSGTPPRPGDVEIWEIENRSGGWFHPLHLHLVDVKILSRTGGAGVVRPWERGPKDTVYVGEGETLRVITRYDMAPEQYPDGRSTGLAGRGGASGGRYMIHCHNLPHEDHDMMGQFQVGTTPLVNDPLGARAKDLPADGLYPDGPDGGAQPEQLPDRL